MAGSKTRLVVILVVAALVLGGGIVAALVHDSGGKKKATPSTTSTTVRATTTTARRSTTTTSTSTTSTSTTVASTTTTTAEPAVPTPEQAATGLFAAYRDGNRDQAAMFATDDVVAVMFEQPYQPPDGTFQGCRPDGDDVFQCSIVQGTYAAYELTAQRSPQTGSFLIVIITVSGRSSPTTTAPAP